MTNRSALPANKMEKLGALLTLLLAMDAMICVAALPPRSDGHASGATVHFITRQELHKILDTHPAVVEINAAAPTVTRTNGSRAYLISYALGDRIVGERLEFYESDRYAWPQPQDVRLTINYDTDGGSVITRILLQVTQSTQLGRAFIVGGGIGQQSISLVVEALSTSVFNYELEVYTI